MEGRYTKEVGRCESAWGREGGTEVNFRFPEPCPVETFEVKSQTNEPGPTLFYPGSGYSSKGCTIGMIYDPVYRAGYEGVSEDIGVNATTLYNLGRNLICNVEKLIDVVIRSMDEAQAQEFLQDLNQYMGINMPEKYKKAATIEAPAARHFTSNNSDVVTVDMKPDTTAGDLSTMLTGMRPK